MKPTITELSIATLFLLVLVGPITRAADTPKTIPDGVKVQFFVANNQLSDANGRLKAMAEADPKLKKVLDDLGNAQKVFTVALDNGRKACGGPVDVVGGDLKCVEPKK